MRLDHDRPHGIVSGLPGVCFQQDGRYFARNGNEVDDPEAPLRAEPEVVEAAPRAEPASSGVGVDDLRLAENRRLKAMLDVYGEPWMGQAAAKQFLAGKG